MGGSKDSSFIYLDGNPYTLQKGSFPGASVNALPLDGKVSLSYGSTTAALDQYYSDSIWKNGVELIAGSCNGGNTNWGGCSGYVSFITAYGLNTAALASADISKVTVNYWLKKV